jgi:hypothetical protein
MVIEYNKKLEGRRTIGDEECKQCLLPHGNPYKQKKQKKQKKYKQKKLHNDSTTR